MRVETFFHNIVDPTLGVLAQIINIPVTDKARVLVTTIAGQESEWAARRQHGGPARSYWQFELGGGVAELFAVTPNQLRIVCSALDIPYDQATVFEAMAWNDALACSMARLLLWQDPAALPEVGDVEAGWAYYLRNWRPGAPHHDVWAECYSMSLAAMKSP